MHVHCLVLENRDESTIGFHSLFLRKSKSSPEHIGAALNLQLEYVVYISLANLPCEYQ